MRLAQPVYADNITKGKQNTFHGLNQSPGAGDGEICAMKNLTSDCYPMLATRARRKKYKTLAEPGGLFEAGGLCWIEQGDFYYKGEKKSTPEGGYLYKQQSQAVRIGSRIVFVPAMLCYNTETDEFEKISDGFIFDGISVRFKDGTLHGEAASMNTVEALLETDGMVVTDPRWPGFCWEDFFRVGDAITISDTGLNDKTLILREISGLELHFDENVFTAQETAESEFSREAPLLRYACESGNRLWGCDGHTIYASKLGDPFNFYVYDGLETDSYSVDTGSKDEFTGCINYRGYPTFFKEGEIYKVYGNLPSNFEVLSSAALGVAPGSGGSLAIADGTLVYHSRVGICLYGGGTPTVINRAFGLERYKNAAAGSDGLKYWVSMQDCAGAWHMFVYDSQRGLWHEEDNVHATHYAYSDGCLYFLQDDGTIWITGNTQDAPQSATDEEAFDWFAEFADFTDYSGKGGTPNMRGLSKLQIRLKLDEGATFKVKLKIDDGPWTEPGGEHVHGRTHYMAFVPQRADTYRIRLEGTGGCCVYSIAREFYPGSEL